MIDFSEPMMLETSSGERVPVQLGNGLRIAVLAGDEQTAGMIVKALRMLDREAIGPVTASVDFEKPVASDVHFELGERRDVLREIMIRAAYPDADLIRPVMVKQQQDEAWRRQGKRPGRRLR